MPSVTMPASTLLPGLAPTSGVGVTVASPQELASLKRRILRQAQALAGSQTQHELLIELAELHRACSALRELLFITEGDLQQTCDTKSH